MNVVVEGGIVYEGSCDCALAAVWRGKYGRKAAVPKTLRFCWTQDEMGTRGWKAM